MQSQEAKIVIVETFNSLQNAEFLAERVGGKAIVLAQEVKAIAGVDTYEKLFEYDIDRLIAGFEEVGIDPAGSE